MIKIFSTFCVAIAGFSVTASAQMHRRCGTNELAQKLTFANPTAYSRYTSKMGQMRTEAQSSADFAAKGTAQYAIPVVFHIVVTQTMLNKMGGTTGVSQRIDSQLAVLNRDFNRKNSDSVSIPSAFKPLYANIGIKFGRAKLTPGGQTTTGYDIRVIAAGADSVFEVGTGTQGSTYGCSDAKYTSRGLAAWDPTKYFNVWVVEITEGGQSGILGVTAPPSFISQGFPAEETGVALTYEAFGKRRLASDYYFTGIDLGRTLTHETGHFFELLHVWGDDDDQNANGYCPTDPNGSDDGIADTPPQSRRTYCDFPNHSGYNCPTFPLLDACSPTSPGVMFMNYMDYVDDVAMKMFTIGQKSVMQAQIVAGAESYSLTQQAGLVSVPTTVNDVTAALVFSVSPNPSDGLMNVIFGQDANVHHILVSNSLGQVVYNADVNSNNGMQTIDLSAAAKGIYFVKCTSETGSMTQKLVLQ